MWSHLGEAEPTAFLHLHRRGAEWCARGLIVIGHTEEEVVPWPCHTHIKSLAFFFQARYLLLIELLCIFACQFGKREPRGVAVVQRLQLHDNILSIVYSLPWCVAFSVLPVHSSIHVQRAVQGEQASEEMVRREQHGSVECWHRI